MLSLANPTLRLFIGAALISLSPVWVKLVSVSATASGFWRLAIGGVVIALYLLVTRRRVRSLARIWQVLILAAFFLALRPLVISSQHPAHWPGSRDPACQFPGLRHGGRRLPDSARAAKPPAAHRYSPGALRLGVDRRCRLGGLPRELPPGIVFGLAAAVTYAAYLLSMRRSRRTRQTRCRAGRSRSYRWSARDAGSTAFVEGDSLAVSSSADAYGLPATAFCRTALACCSLPAACRMSQQRRRAGSVAATDSEFRLGCPVLCAAPVAR